MSTIITQSVVVISDLRTEIYLALYNPNIHRAHNLTLIKRCFSYKGEEVDGKLPVSADEDMIKQ